MQTDGLIFKNTDVKLSLSTKHDGHMSFGHDSDQKTTANINNFLNHNIPSRQHTAGIACTYGPEKTFDQIIEITSQNAKPINLIRRDRFETDALVTKLMGTVLLLPVADCFPLIIFDPSQKVLALAHLGWQATNANLASKLVSHLEENYSSKPQNLLCFFGPGISFDHYVFEDVIQKYVFSWQGFIKKSKTGYHLNLLGYNINQLKKAGITAEHIESSSRNTVDDENLESNYMHNKLGLKTARRYMLAVTMI